MPPSDGKTGLAGTTETLVAEQSAPDEPQNHGKLIVDASVVEQAIRYLSIGMQNCVTQAIAPEQDDKLFRKFRALFDWYGSMR